MVKDSHNDRVKELLDGYILGNLSQEEITEFKKIMSEDSKLLEENAILRYVWQLMSQIPPEVETPLYLKATALENESHTDRDCNYNLSWSSIIANLFILIGTTILAIDNHKLRQSFTLIEKKLIIEENEPWRGISQLIKNHFHSLNSSLDPIAHRANDPDELLENLQLTMVLPENLLKLNLENLYLIGGSISEIGGSKGIRFSYQTDREINVSFYQLIRQEANFFPNISSGYIYVTQLDKYNIVLWSDRGIIYAIVAELPLQELQQLANSVEKIT